MDVLQRTSLGPAICCKNCNFLRNSARRLWLSIALCVPPFMQDEKEFTANAVCLFCMMIDYVMMVRYDAGNDRNTSYPLFFQQLIGKRQVSLHVLFQKFRENILQCCSNSFFISFLKFVSFSQAKGGNCTSWRKPGGSPANYWGFPFDWSQSRNSCASAHKVQVGESFLHSPLLTAEKLQGTWLLERLRAHIHPLWFWGLGWIGW